MPAIDLSRRFEVVRAVESLSPRKSGCLGFAVWTLGILVLTALLTLDFLPLLHEYRHNNVETDIVVISTHSGSTRPPNLSVCLPYPSRALSDIARSLIEGNQTGGKFEFEYLRAMSDRSWDVWRSIDLSEYKSISNSLHYSDQTKLEKDLSVDLILKVIDQNFSASVLNLNRSNFNWNQPIIDAIANVLECIQIRDFAFVTNFNSDLIDWPPCERFDTILGARLTRNDLEVLIDYLIKAIRTYLKSEVTFDGDSTSQKSIDIDSIDRGRALLISPTQICFPLLANSTQESFEFVAFDQIDPPPWLRSDRSTPFFVWPDQRALYAFSYASGSLYATDRDRLATINREYVEIAFDIDLRVIETRRSIDCTSDPDPMVLCVIRRQLRETIKNCGCSPFAYRLFVQESMIDRFDQQIDLSIDRLTRSNRSIDQMPICTRSSYASCRNILANTSKSHECFCANKCEYAFYKSSLYFEAIRDNSSRNQLFTISFPRHDRSPFVEFRVGLKDSPQKFLSQIGGLINFYLGFSGLSVLAFAIFVFDSIRSSWCSGRIDRDLQRRSIGAISTVDARIEQFGKKPVDQSEIEKKLDDLSKIVREAISDQNRRLDQFEKEILRRPKTKNVKI